jgi:general secretion pathway protein J
MIEPSTRRASSRAARGFTLVELLAGMAVVALTLALAGAGLRVISRDWERNARRVDHQDMLARTFDLLQRDAAAAQRVVGTLSDDAWFVFSGQPGEVSFVVLEPPYPTPSGAYFVNYAFGERNGAVELIRARAPFSQNMMNFPGATPANRVVLMSGNFQYSFSYGERTAGGRTVWHGAWTYEDRFPDLIQLLIADVETGEALAPPIVVSLRADAELECVGFAGTNCTVKTSGQLQPPASRPVATPTGGAAAIGAQKGGAP